MDKSHPGRPASFVFIFITVALDMLALGIIIPVLPQLIVGFEGGDMARAAAITGVFGFVWALMQFLGQPVLGAASDRFGRRRVILLSNMGLGLDYLVMALAPSLGWLFVGRIISGLTAASIPAASAYIADITPPEGRAARFGMLGAAFGLGFVLGPAIGGVLGGFDPHLPFYAAAGMSLVNAAYGFFVLPESLPAEARTPRFTWKSANIAGGLSLLVRTPLLVGLAISLILHSLAHESLPSIYVLYTSYRYQWDTTLIGGTLAIVGLASAIVSAALIKPVVTRLGDWRTLFVGLACGAAAFGIYGAAPTGAMFLVGVPFGAFWGLANPAEQALMSREMGPEEQGRLQGALGSLRGVTGMVGPLIFSQIFALSIATSTWAGAGFGLASLLLAASLGAAVWAKMRGAAR